MKNWIRGVNLAGWLVLERMITPYLFAITSCHLEGHFCSYPGQLSLPSQNVETVPYCSSLKQCKPVLVKNSVTGKEDYPVNEYTLLSQFEENPLAAASFLQQHYDFFVTRQDVVALHEAGITHVRVPIHANPHSRIIHSEQEEDPLVIHVDAWLYFVRLVGWCRQLDIKVWPEIVFPFHPSQESETENECELVHSHNATLEALQRMAVAIHNDGIHDVVTGISLSPPRGNCEVQDAKTYYNDALQIVRHVLGNVTLVVNDLHKNATLWNGFWETKSGTYLDSHFDQVSTDSMRALSPKQHVALTCRRSARQVHGCCFQHEDDFDSTSKLVPSSGMSRLVGSWNAAYDTLPQAMLQEIMQGIYEHGEMPQLHRNLTQAQRDFLLQFTKAQMVVYESNTTTSGWFYSNIKMEGGAFAEWDFLRGIREKWIPQLPARNASSTSVYGACEHILANTSDDNDIIQSYPEHSKTTDEKDVPPLDDDLVVSHGDSLKDTEEGDDETVYTLDPSVAREKDEESKGGDDGENDHGESGDDAVPSTDDTKQKKAKKGGGGHHFFTLLVLGFFAYAIKRVFFSPESRGRGLGYSSVHGSSSGEAVTMAV